MAKAAVLLIGSALFAGPLCHPVVRAPLRGAPDPRGAPAADGGEGNTGERTAVERIAGDRTAVTDTDAVPTPDAAPRARGILGWPWHRTDPARRNAKRASGSTSDASAPHRATSPAAPVSDAPEAAILTLTLNGVDRGDVTVYVDADTVWVDAAALAGAGLTLDGATRSQIEGGTFVSLASVRDRVTWRLDERDLTLAITARGSDLARSVVNLRRDMRPAGIEYSGDSSVFVNYGARLVDLERFEGYAEGGISVKSGRFYTGVTFPSAGGPVRGITTFTLDDRPRRNRLVFGDNFADGGALGGGVWLGGARFQHTHTIDPYFVSGPTLDHEAVAVSPSTLEVYVNGHLVHREAVEPGPIDVHDIPVTAGAGDTRIVLRDALGREQTVTASYYRPGSLLAPGEQEYSYAVGAQREGVGMTSFDYGALGALGTHRIGITPALTLGARAEGSLDRISGGLEGVAGTPIGQWEIAGGTSVTEQVPGAAGSLAWTWAGRRFGASVWGRFLSDDYTTLGLDRADDRAIAETGASLGVPIARRVTVSASWALSAMRDSGVRQRASLTSGVSLPQNLALELDGSWSEEAAGSDSWSAHLGVTRAFGRRTTATVRAESDDALQSGYAEVNHSRPAGEGAGFRLGGRAGDTYEAFGDLDAEGRIGRFLADYHWSPELDGGSFGVAGGLTWIGGRVFASRPIDGSYALVRVPGVAKVHAYLNNNDVGVTDRRGDLIVPGLVPYYGNRLSIDDADVPIDYQIGGTERVIAPPDRSGAIVRFDVTAAHIVRGGVAAPGGDTAYGELAVDVDGQPHTSPIGRDGTFELADLPEGSWVGEVRYASGVCSVGLTVPHGAEPIVDVGALRCDPSSQVAHR